MVKSLLHHDHRSVKSLLHHDHRSWSNHQYIMITDHGQITNTPWSQIMVNSLLHHDHRSWLNHPCIMIIHHGQIIHTLLSNHPYIMITDHSQITHTSWSKTMIYEGFYLSWLDDWWSLAIISTTIPGQISKSTWPYYECFQLYIYLFGNQNEVCDLSEMEKLCRA